MYSKRTMTVGISLTVTLLVGCAGSSMFTTYPSRLDPIRSQAASGDFSQPKETLDSILDASDVSDRVLYLQERARIATFDGPDLETSIRSYSEAIEILEQSDEEAAVTVSGAASQGASLLTSDNAISYSPPAHERILVRTYQALNFIELGSQPSDEGTQGDLERALVEMRNAEDEQEMLRNRLEEDVEKLQAEIREKESESGLPPVGAAPSMGSAAGGGVVMTALTAVPDWAGARQGMEDSVAEVKSAYENAYTYYVSGLIYEMSGGTNNAQLAIQQYANALILQPGNRYLQDTAFRLAKDEGDTKKPQLTEFSERHGEPELGKVPDDSGRVVVVLEQGFVDAKKQIKVPIPVSGRIYTIALPYYGAAESDPTFSEVFIDGESLGSTEELLDVRRLAVRSLLDEYKIILLRQALRLTVKDIAQRAVQQAGGDLASLALGIVDAIVTNADMRSWLTLPANVQMASFHVPPGERQLRIQGADGMGVDVDISVDTGEIVLIRAHELSGGKIQAKVIAGNIPGGF